MIRRSAPTRGRAGITLTEILISILIMGVGLISLATLFPIGLLRLRNAQRSSRSAFLVESAGSDLGSRDLFNKASFTNPAIGVLWYNAGGSQYDPWIQDTPSYGAAAWTNGVYRGLGGTGRPPNTQATPLPGGPGLPVCYDPLWRFQTFSITTGTNGYYLGDTTEARFASGLGFVYTEPNASGNAGGSTNPSAYGLQRLTNFVTGVPANIPALLQLNSIFVSPEDIVFQNSTGTQGVGTLSPLTPDLTLNPGTVVASANPQVAQVTTDWRYSWLFTGTQADAGNGTVFVGDIVIVENRPFSLDIPTNAPFAAQLPNAVTVPQIVAGEPVVEAIFGYTRSPLGAAVPFYGPTSSRTVVLRWPATVPDPDIRVGGWIADVTYERNLVEDTARWNDIYSGQRCYWYQVVRKTPAGVDTLPDIATRTVTNYRSMTVWVGTPLKALTPLNANGTPFHVNAALVSPSVVNVFPRTFYSR